MKTLEINRIINGTVRGSSRPVIAETDSGLFFIKLRGAAQGCGALIAEIIVNELAKGLDLNVLPISLAILKPNTPTDDKNDELADLLNGSCGLNIALPYLEDARDTTKNDFSNLTIGEMAATLWLDKFVMNPDRNQLNPNMLFCNNAVFLIDHGASLRFQYDWAKVTELTPHKVGSQYEPHLFESLLQKDSWKHWDELFSQIITREVLHRSLEIVPDNFIESLIPNSMLEHTSEEKKKETILRRKEAYVAFLWKRLKAPRNFALNSVEFKN